MYYYINYISQDLVNNVDSWPLWAPSPSLVLSPYFLSDFCLEWKWGLDTRLHKSGLSHTTKFIDPLIQLQTGQFTDIGTASQFINVVNIVNNI